MVLEVGLGARRFKTFRSDSELVAYATLIDATQEKALEPWKQLAEDFLLQDGADAELNIGHLLQVLHAISFAPAAVDALRENFDDNLELLREFIGQQ